MKTKPRGIHATFQTECVCGGVLTVTNGKIDPHTCEPRPVTIYAEHDEVREWRAVRKQILDKLETEMNHH